MSLLPIKEASVANLGKISRTYFLIDLYLCLYERNISHFIFKRKEICYKSDRTICLNSIDGHGVILATVVMALKLKIL